MSMGIRLFFQKILPTKNILGIQRPYTYITLLTFGAALLLTACGPDLALFNSPTDLYINSIALTGNQSGFAVGLQPGQKRAVLLDLTANGWKADSNPPPIHQGDALTVVATTSDTLRVGGILTDAAHDNGTKVTGFVYTRGKDGVWNRKDFAAAINGMAFLDDNEGWAVGNSGAIYHFTQGIWKQTSTDMTFDLYGVAIRSPQSVWAVGDHGAFMQFDGTKWQDIPHFTHQTLYSIAVTADNGWAVGTDGTVVHWDNVKQEWYETVSPMTNAGRSVIFAGDNAWVVGDYGDVFQYTPDDQYWHKVKSPNHQQFNTIARTPSGTLWVGGNFNQTSLLTYNSTGWQAIPIPLSHG